MWNKWQGACRYCFNQAIAYQKENGKISKLKLRNIIMNSHLPDWVKSTPCHIRQNAVFDAHQAYTASKNCQFRSCKSPRQTIKFNHSNYKSGKWYPSLTKLNWAHYRFKLHLKQKAELNGCNVIDVTEEFTSKTCIKCGHIHQKLGGSKIFKCPECNHRIARDFNGAFGVRFVQSKPRNRGMAGNC